MATRADTLFLGITWHALTDGIVPAEGEPVLSQIARAVFGAGTAPYYTVQAATLLILVLAANTAFADFPRLASILARDGYLPRQLQNRGDRLAFSNGILGLGAFAALLLVVFQGETHALIPLYMVGVFLAFTLSQAGMVVRWRRLRSSGWRRRAVVNGLGAAVTALVLVVVAVTKTTEGAWLTLVLIPAHVAFFRATRRHYQAVAAQLRLPAIPPPTSPRRHVVVLLIGGVHRAVINALDYARSVGGDVRAVYVALEPAATDDVRAHWAVWGRGVPLVVLDSEYRSLLTPVDRYLSTLADDPDVDVTVVLPEFVPARWWHHLFHNQRALLIKAFLLRRPNVAVTNVPFHLAR
jgi:hypothetical protein